MKHKRGGVRMEKSTITLGAVLALLVTAAGLFLLGGTLSAKLDVMTATASDYPKAYASIARIVESDTAIQRFSEPLPADPAGCRLEDVTITLNNRGLFDAEWVSVSVDGAPGDIAVYSIAGEGGTIPARGTGTVNLKLVANAGSTGTRTYHLQYYVYGMKRTVSVTQDGVE